MLTQKQKAAVLCAHPKRWSACFILITVLYNHTAQITYKRALYSLQRTFLQQLCGEFDCKMAKMINKPKIHPIITQPDCWSFRQSFMCHNSPETQCQRQPLSRKFGPILTEWIRTVSAHFKTKSDVFGDLRIILASIAWSKQKCPDQTWWQQTQPFSLPLFGLSACLQSIIHMCSLMEAVSLPSSSCSSSAMDVTICQGPL